MAEFQSIFTGQEVDNTINKLRSWIAVDGTYPTVTISGVTYAVIWKSIPVSGTACYGIGLHPTTGRPYQIYYNGSSYSATALDTDTKNTAGSTNSTSKLFLIGAGSQAANPQTYSNSAVYTQNGKLYSNSAEVSVVGHTHSFDAITNRGEAFLSWGGKDFSGSYGPIDAAMVPELGANRLAFMPAAAISVEYSRDGGSTWTDYGADNTAKINLFNGNGTSLIIGKATSGAGNVATNQYQLRINIYTGAASVYTVLNKFVIYLSTSGTGNNWCTIRARKQSDYTAGNDTWTVFANKVTVSGWSGYNVINTSGLTTFGNTAASQYGHIQFIFGCDTGSTNNNYAGLTINKIFGFGGVGWTTPSTMAKTGHMYTYDASKNVSFPANVSATSFTENGTTLSNKYMAKSIFDAAGDLLVGSGDNTYTRLAKGTSGQFLSINSSGNVAWVNNPNTDTDKKTASSNNDAKLFLIGAAVQSTDGQATYSNSKVYTQSGKLYSNNTEVLTAHATHVVTVKSGKKSDGSTDISANSGTATSGNMTVTLGDSGVSAGNYGNSSNQEPGYGSTFNVPYITVNAKGIVTAISNKTVKIPASDNTNTTLSGVAYCNTAAGTAAKVATMPGFALLNGQRIILKLENKSTVANATLNVNNTGAKTIKIGGSNTNTENLTAGYWLCYYDGTNWNLIENDSIVLQSNSGNSNIQLSITDGWDIAAAGLKIKDSYDNYVKFAFDDGPNDYDSDLSLHVDLNGKQSIAILPNQNWTTGDGGYATELVLPANSGILAITSDIYKGIATQWESANSYAVGDKVFYGSNLYRCIQADPYGEYSPEDFPTYWQQISSTLALDTDITITGATDNILDATITSKALKYAPYTSQQSKLSFDTSTSNPTRTDRLNLNGYLYATKFNVAGKAAMQYNATEECIEFIFA